MPEITNQSDSRITVQEHQITPNVPYRAPGEAEPAKPGKAKPKNLTQEEIEERRKSILESMGYDQSLAKEEPAPEVQKTPEEIEAERIAAEKAEEEAAADQARKDEEARQAELEASKSSNPTAEEREAALVERTVKSTVEAVKELLPKVKPEVAAEIAALSDEDQADLEAVELLELQKKIPEGMKGKMLEFYQACAAYQKQWEKDHPGETYNAEDEEHAQKRLSFQPDIDLSLLDDAREDLSITKKVKEANRPYEEARQAERQAQEVNQTLEKAKPAIHKAFRASIVKVIDQVSPAALEILKDKDGLLDLSPEAIAKLEAADPVAKEVLDTIIGQQLHPVVVELEKAAVLGDKWMWDVRNPLHAAIIDEMIDMEKILADAPANVRMQKGREFCTLVDYENQRRDILSSSESAASKEASLAKLARTRWTLNTESIKDSFIDKTAREAQKRIEKADALVKKASGKEPPSRKKGAPTAAAAPVKPAPAAQPARAKHSGPSIASQGDRVSAPGSQQQKPPSVGEAAVQVHFR